MRVLCRARITDVTPAGVYATCAPRGVVGPIDTIGTPQTGGPALLAAVDDTGDLVAICGDDALIELIKTTVASAGDFAAFKAAVAAW